MMIQQHELLKTHSVDNGPGLISEEESVALSGVEQHQTDKLRDFLAKLNPVCQSNSVKNWMDLACCGEAALAVYKDVKAALEQWVPLRRLEEALSDSETEAGREDELSALKCYCCSGLIMDPVCFPCGHSTCKTCIDKLPSPPLASEQQGKMVECPQCRQAWSVYIGSGERRRHPTVLVTRLWNKHLTAQYTAAGLKEKGNTYATEGDYLRAVESYTQSLMAGTRVLYNYAYMVRLCLCCTDTILYTSVIGARSSHQQPEPICIRTTLYCLCVRCTSVQLPTFCVLLLNKLVKGIMQL